MNQTTTKTLLASTALALSLTTASFAQTAATTTTTTAKPHTNIVQRHPYATGLVAGVATHHALKMAAARDKARGKKLNWAERHPTLSAIGVGSVTTHEIKAHTSHAAPVTTTR